jgi:hypothetical protein
MDIHHTTGTVSGNDDESIVPPCLMFGSSILTDGNAENRRSITVSGEMGLLLLSSFVDPFEPGFDSDN